MILTDETEDGDDATGLIPIIDSSENTLSTILDHDLDDGVQVTVTGFTANEDSGENDVFFTFNAPPGKTVERSFVVFYNVTDITATVGDDYEELGDGFVTFSRAVDGTTETTTFYFGGFVSRTYRNCRSDNIRRYCYRQSS